MNGFRNAASETEADNNAVPLPREGSHTGVTRINNCNLLKRLRYTLLLVCQRTINLKYKRCPEWSSRQTCTCLDERDEASYWMQWIVPARKSVLRIVLPKYFSVVFDCRNLIIILVYINITHKFHYNFCNYTPLSHSISSFYVWM